MGRKKGSLNKKIQPVQLDFEDNKKKFDEKTEVLMSNVYDEAIEEVQKELDMARVELEKTRLEIEENKKALSALPVAKQVKDAPATSIEGQSLKAKIAEQKARDNEMVTGKFYNLRVKGQQAKLTYMHHADDPVKWYTFQHGEVYTIPRGFANEINEHYHTPRFIKNENAIINPSQPESGIHEVDTSDKMYSFVPLNF